MKPYHVTALIKTTSPLFDKIDKIDKIYNNEFLEFIVKAQSEKKLLS